MPQLRKDPVISRWVIISTDRGKRPSDFDRSPRKKTEDFCPFCPGNERFTPPEIIAFRNEASHANEPNWLTRVIPNNFPLLQIEGELKRRGMGMFDMMTGIGAHEVIIETPDHDREMGTMATTQIERVLWAYRDRIIDLKKDLRFKYIMVFKNYGKAAGAVLDHPHSQLIAMPVIPKRVDEELVGAREYYEFKERCVFCDMVQQEIASGSRIVSENKDFVAFEPFASRFPFETWILPKRHIPSYSLIEIGEVGNLAWILKDVIWRIGEILHDPPFNYILHTAPLHREDLPEYHFHFEVIPRITKVAGFEWGTGFYINPTIPEEAAIYLRELEAPTEAGSAPR